MFFKTNPLTLKEIGGISEGVSDGLVQVPPLPISFPLSNGPAPKQKEASGIERRKSLIRAYLSKVPRQHGLYRLDFRLSERSRRLGTFLLEQVGNEPESQIYTPSSKRMYSEEVLQLARFWIRKCLSQEHEKCPDENFNNPRNRYWPTRLIELPPHDPTKHDINTGKLEKVRLVAGKDAARIATEEGALRLIHAGLPDRGPGRSGEPSAGANSGLTRSDTVAPPVRGDPETDPSIWQYVTLSHCWGKQRITRLLKENKDDFEKEIPISTLPQTFRDAIEFARRLDRKVRYLWIDSLCIVQDNNDDWARESVQMYEVYRNSYCNISATAACDSHQGIYNKSGRDPQLLWEDEINLNVDGIPGAHSPRKAKHEIGFEAPIRRCTIRDLSFWDRKVDDASVNKRAWVLQERLLAPRVLHFCEDQIAWECSHLDAAESLPHGVSKMELKSGEVKERVRLKSLVPDDFGPKPIEIDAMRTSYAAHEDWKRIVERYSRTRLTLAKDKLIALAGITQMMATRISGLYVAGLWEQYLASQLLWRVNPVYAQSHEDDPTYEDPREEDEVSSGPVSNHLKNKSKRPKRYRAPTFSWAAVDAPQGVELGETMREEELLIAVEKVHVNPKPGSMFGQIEPDCYIEITCFLARIEIDVEKKSDSDINVVRASYSWHWVGLKKNKKIPPEVYLDSPRDDFDSIQGENSRMYCVPAYIDADGNLICLLLQWLKEVNGLKVYRRVGLTVISYYQADQKELRKSWDAHFGKLQRIRLV